MIDDVNDVDVPNFQDEGNANEPGNAEESLKIRMNNRMCVYDKVGMCNRTLANNKTWKH